MTIPEGVNIIGEQAFSACTELTDVTIPNSVSGIGDYAFSKCLALESLFFSGNAPRTGVDLFDSATDGTVYYLPGTIGWNSALSGRPTALWQLPYPVILDFGPSFGVQSNGFGFIISWATNASVAVEACTNLANPIWSPIATNSLTGGWSYFSHPEWADHPANVYRLRSR